MTETKKTTRKLERKRDRETKRQRAMEKHDNTKKSKLTGKHCEADDAPVVAW